MIIKSKSRRTRSFDQLVTYLLHDKGRSVDLDLVQIQNLRGRSPQEWISEFEANEDGKPSIRKNAVRVIHEIISFHDLDKRHLSIDDVAQVAREYMARRSRNGMLIAVPHLNDDHVHIHICGSPWESFSGPSLRMSRSGFQEFKESMESWQRENHPRLTHSHVDHGKARNSLGGPERKPRLASIKERLLNTLALVDSRAEFLETLNRAGLEVYYRSEKPQGVLMDGKKYRFRRFGLNLQSEDIFLAGKRDLIRNLQMQSTKRNLPRRPEIGRSTKDHER